MSQPVPPRNTRQRTAVAELMETQEQFRTAQQVHDLLRDKGTAVGLTTVYRTLQALAEAGELDAVRKPDGEVSYRRCAPGHHHHLVCRNCGKTVEVSGEVVERWARSVASENGFRDVAHDFEFFGLCADC